MPTKKKTDDAKATAPKPKKASPKKEAPKGILESLSYKESTLFYAAAERARMSPEEAAVALLKSHLRKGMGTMAVSADMRRFSR